MIFNSWVHICHAGDKNIKYLHLVVEILNFEPFVSRVTDVDATVKISWPADPRRPGMCGYDRRWSLVVK